MVMVAILLLSPNWSGVFESSCWGANLEPMRNYTIAKSCFRKKQNVICHPVTITNGMGPICLHVSLIGYYYKFTFSWLINVSCGSHCWSPSTVMMVLKMSRRVPYIRSWNLSIAANEQKLSSPEAKTLYFIFFFQYLYHSLILIYE